MDRDCNKCVWHTDGNCKKWDCEYKTVEDIRADAIEEFKTDIINKINFEEKWLFDCKSNNADTNIVFSALRTFVENKAEQLKENNNEEEL